MILYITIILLLTTVLFAGEEETATAPSDKTIDFSIGGLYSHTCNIAISVADLSMVLREGLYYEPVSVWANQSFALLLPVSIVFPFKKKLSLGFSNNMGLAVGLSGGIYPYPFFNGQSRLVVLYGKNTNKQFLSEYGIAYAIVLMGFRSYLGPSFYFGYQMKFKKHIMLTLGGNLEYLAGFNMDWYPLYYSMLNIGFDIRLKFYKAFQVK